MCKSILKNGRLCRINSKSEYCYHHKLNDIKKINNDLLEKTKTIEELNKTIINVRNRYNSLIINFKILKTDNEDLTIKNFQLKDEIDQLENINTNLKINLKKEIKNLNKTIEKKVKIIKETDISYQILNNTNNKQIKIINEHKEKIDLYKEDYNKFQIIKQFEKYKKDLINKGINIYKYKNQEYHDLRYQRNICAHIIV